MTPPFEQQQQQQVHQHQQQHNMGGTEYYQRNNMGLGPPNPHNNSGTGVGPQRPCSHSKGPNRRRQQELFRNLGGVNYTEYSKYAAAGRSAGGGEYATAVERSGR